MKFKLALSTTLFIISFFSSFNSSAQPETKHEIKITKLDEGVWLHTSFYIYPSGIKFPSNGLIVKEGKSLTLIDTAWGELQTQSLLDKIKLNINLPVTKAVVTHAHGDRASGVDILEAQGI